MRQSIPISSIKQKSKRLISKKYSIDRDCRSKLVKRIAKDNIENLEDLTYQAMSLESTNKIINYIHKTDTPDNTYQIKLADEMEKSKNCESNFL